MVANPYVDVWLKHAQELDDGRGAQLEESLDGELADFVDTDVYQPPVRNELELKAVAAKEAKVEVFRYEAAIAAEARDVGQARRVAHVWACSAQYVNTMADVWTTFPEELIVPDVPLALYRAALETDCPVDALQLALREGWSPRQLRDHFDILKGKHLSDTRFAGEAEVELWSVEEGRVTLAGLPLSGEQPAKVRASLREVLEPEI